MTRVLYEPNKRHLRIEGHAGSAPKGEDLVCAGVSALGYALVKATARENQRIVMDEDAGIIDAQFLTLSFGDAQRAWGTLEAIAGGLEWLAEEYPDYVTFERRD